MYENGPIIHQLNLLSNHKFYILWQRNTASINNYQIIQLIKVLEQILHWQVMANDDPRLKRIFPTPSVVAYKRGKNLRHLISKGRFC